MFADICTGLISILTPETIGAVALGIFTGLMFGAIPGISGIMAISILLPLTFYVSPLVGIPMLLGIYKASMFGGSITAVLLNTPGAPPAVCTAMDGYPLTKQGKAGKGLNAALVGSVFGDTFSNILLICVAAPLSYLTLKVGPVEQCSLILLALTVVGSISGSSILKGILCAGVGILLATVGVSGTTGAMRFTFENENLMSGIALIPMVIGLLCLPEVIHQACSGIRKTFEQQFDLSGENGRLSWQEIKSRIPVLLRSSIIGSVIGAMPGLGASPAAYMAYSEAQRTSKHPEQFGKGAIEGVMAPEAANNAVTSSAMIPLLTLGIPGDDVTAVLMGGLIIQGLQPGPELFTRYAPMTYTFFAGFVLVQFFMLGIGLLGCRGFAQISRLSDAILIPSVAVLCVVGSFAIHKNFFDVVIMMIFGVLGYLVRKFDLNPAAIVLALILGPIGENGLRRSLRLSGGSPAILFSTPLCWVLIALCVFGVCSPIFMNRMEKKAVENAGGDIPNETGDDPVRTSD